MAGAFSSAFSSAFDIDAGGVLPSAPLKGTVSGGLMFARKQLQYIALAGPLLIPAAAAPDLAISLYALPVRRPFFLADTRSPAIGQADPVVVPDLLQAFGEVPVRRRFDLRHTHSTEYGRADPPPPAAPDLVSLSEPVVPRRARTAEGLTLGQSLLPPGFPPDWYPSAEYQIRRRRFLTAEAFALPPERPTIPFEPAQGASILPQPPLRPLAISARAALSTVPPVGPPSSALTPPNVLDWQGLANQPPATARPRLPQDTAVQNLVPIPQPTPPENSWQPSAEVPPLGLLRRPWLEAFAQNIDPISTPAYLASFWLSYVPPGPFPKLGLLPALQQWLGEAPPIIEIIVQAGSWRAEAPALLYALRRLTPEAFAAPQEMTTLGDAFGCISLSSVRVTQPLLLAQAVIGPLLIDVSVTSSTLLVDEVC